MVTHKTVLSGKPLSFVCSKGERDKDFIATGPGGGEEWGGGRGKRVMYHVITLSAIGEADTPAGGSVCMRCLYQSHGMINQL